VVQRGWSKEAKERRCREACSELEAQLEHEIGIKKDLESKLNMIQSTVNRDTYSLHRQADHIQLPSIGVSEALKDEDDISRLKKDLERITQRNNEMRRILANKLSGQE